MTKLRALHADRANLIREFEEAEQIHNDCAHWLTRTTDAQERAQLLDTQKAAHERVLSTHAKISELDAEIRTIEPTHEHYFIERYRQQREPGLQEQSSDSSHREPDADAKWWEQTATEEPSGTASSKRR